MSDRGARVVAGSANRALARSVAAVLAVAPVAVDMERFPDGELRPAVAEVRGEDVYVLQPTGPPVNEHLVELLLLLDACRRAGAARLTAVVPYFGYARQDRRGKAGEAVGVRVVADALAAAGADRLVVIDPHTVALEAVCPVPVEMLTAVPALAAALRPLIADAAVLVAPDLGAVKLAERYASILRRQVIVIRKTRVSGEVVRAHELVGEVRERPAVIVDDMISTGSTVEAATAVLDAYGAAPGPTVAATHGPLVSGALERMEAAGVARAVVTDTVARRELPLDDVELGSLRVCSVAGLLADAIDRLHRDRPLDDLLIHA
jgi:ribose-phosphate pyrophosphokinase